MISYAIQAHPARTNMAETLAAEIPGCEIVYDPEPDSFRNPWRTYRRALELTPPGVTHRVIIQDDALLCRNFAKVMPRVVAAQPDRMIALFVAGLPHQSKMRLFWACERDQPFAVLSWDQWVPTVAVVWPVAAIVPALEFVDAQDWPRGFTADDEIVGRVARSLLVEVVATVPSLVQHPDDVDSLGGPWRAMHGRNEARVAACFIHEDDDPLDIDWTR